MANFLMIAAVPAMEAVSIPTADAAPAACLSLAELEANLEAYADALDTVTPEQESEFLADFGMALAAAKEKRDRVQAFLVDLETRAAAAKAEKARQQVRIDRYGGMVERLEAYVAKIIVNSGADAKGKYCKLEGETVTFSVRACPATVELVDEGAVPARHKTVHVSLPAETWETLLDSLDLEFRARVLDQIKRPDVTVSKTSIKAEIEREAPDTKKQLQAYGRVSVAALPGAALIAGRLSLVRG